MTPSMKIALDDLALEKIAVVYPGEKKYRLSTKVSVAPFTEAVAGMAALFG